LPKSDDETVDNLIDLPVSPLKNTLLPKVNVTTEKHVETNVIFSKDNIKELENEFIDKKNGNKKAITARLLLDLEKLIKEDNNPDAYKILNDLQKLLGMECDNNSEILQLHLQNINSCPITTENKNIDELYLCTNTDNSNYELNTSKKNVLNDNKINFFNSKEILVNKQNNTNSNLKLNVNGLKENISDNKIKINEFQYTKKNKKNLDNLSESENLAGILINTLNNFVDEKNKNSAVDILRSLGAALSMATDSGTKNNHKQNSDIKKNKHMPIKFHRSSNSLHKSPNSKNITLKVKIKNSKNLFK
jgi:hypothetical protein